MRNLFICKQGIVRFMGSLPGLRTTLCAHEPETRKVFGIKPSIFRFMESHHANSGAHWDHEPRAWSADLQVGAFGARHTAPSWSSALRFMESHHANSGAHWDHEPEIRKLFGIKPSVFRFMESLPGPRR